MKPVHSPSSLRPLFVRWLLHVEVTMLRDAALAWLRFNVRDQRLHRDFAWHYDQATRQGINCYMAIGPGMTNSGKPQLLHCFSEELFIFELTLAQAKAYQLLANEVMWGTSRRDKPDAAEPIVTMSDPPTIRLSRT